MTRRHGLQSDVLVSLSIVMLTATTVLGAVLMRTHLAHVTQLRLLAARSLFAEARVPLPPSAESVPGIRWWIVTAEGEATPRGEHAQPLLDAGIALAQEARVRRAPMLRAGPPWEPILFAAPSATGHGMVVAWLPPVVAPVVILAVLAAVAAVFTGFGAYLLRRRLVLPLQRLAAAARSIADGEAGARVPVDGVAETAEVAVAFNDMTDALEGRTAELEKAVSDLRESNERLRTARAGLDRAERLAAVGRLAAGVAHEVGNPMGALLSFVELAHRDVGVAAESRKFLERAAEQGERVRDILRQLLDYSRPPRGIRERVDLCVLSRETAELVRAQRRYAAVSIEVSSEEEPTDALADRGGVMQILLNLFLNAADALVEAGSANPAIRVLVRPAARRVRAGEGPSAAREVARRRQFDAVECVVMDNGPGIPEEDRERIFDPFFTTKPSGDGTGLGLSNAARFADEFGGCLELDDGEREGGAVFVLRLPAAGSDRPPETATR